MIRSPAGQITQPPSDPCLACPKAWSAVRLVDGSCHSLCRWLLIPGMQALFSLLYSPEMQRRSCHRGWWALWAESLRHAPFLHPLEAVSHWAEGCLSLTLDIFTAPVCEASPLIDTGVRTCILRSRDTWEARTHSTSGPGIRSYKPCSIAKR